MSRLNTQSCCEFTRSARICELLRRASTAKEINKELREEAKDLLAREDPVSWLALHRMCEALGGASRSDKSVSTSDDIEKKGDCEGQSSGIIGRGDGEEGPWLHLIISDSQAVFKPPPQRIKDPAHAVKMDQLREQESIRKYGEMTSDVDARETKEANTESFSSYKDQLGFGVHVIVVMFTLYLVGVHVGKSISSEPIVELAGGLVGCIFGMFLETTLFIIRSNR
mmetsp:Transcript_25603/g.35356  ORF Transcript_25603/g.35356 Transcript_25603/m.35356 type:complete len:225 (+) Transcript_25603:129-803(+)|eukprot:CAMPEP_0196584846 /NCGR_PEP_ID=MMETSP1081-20130531/48697_1 /TAXON_ID=36882 /ORGANISM="Pyramimonas amylifera, Strain CCMP720" /LENGTH=224 /DNA_ID=CAMNT_0041906203 /DNA_START=125 /DNA_END=799 /DNA_ORIENTATION=-